MEIHGVLVLIVFTFSLKTYCSLKGCLIYEFWLAFFLRASSYQERNLTRLQWNRTALQENHQDRLSDHRRRLERLYHLLSFIFLWLVTDLYLRLFYTFLWSHICHFKGSATRRVTLKQLSYIQMMISYLSLVEKGE